MHLLVHCIINCTALNLTFANVVFWLGNRGKRDTISFIRFVIARVNFAEASSSCI